MTLPPRIYVAGPIRAKTRRATILNIRRAEDASIAIMAAGGAVYCPHTMDQDYSDSFSLAQFLQADFAWIQVSDAIFLCEGWERSEGTLAERTYALEQGIPVFTDLMALRVWIAVTSGEDLGLVAL